jgi:hypothetical protein
MEGKIMRLTFVKLWLLPIILLMGTLVLAAPAWADFEWLYTHGHSGQIQDPSAVSGGPTGGGLIFTLTGISTFVHFAVPSKTLTYDTSTTTQTQWKVRQLRLKCWTGSADARITKIHVWDGNILFKEINYAFADGLYGYKDIIVPLGQKWAIYRALGVTIEVTRGVESMSHDFAFYAVGARWEQ